MEQLNIKAIITATTKKGVNVDGTPATRKTAYFEADTENAKLATDFGFTQYSTKAENKKFFMVVLTEIVDVYNQYGNVVKTLSGGLETPNFSTEAPVNLAILKGEAKGNTFYRLKGIQGEVQEVEAQNLFAEISDEAPED